MLDVTIVLYGLDSTCAQSDTLQLTLWKAERARLWLAPWPGLLDQIEKRERQSAMHGDKPKREQIRIHGWDEVQKEEAWELVIPYRAGPRLAHDDLRIGVTASTLNVHIVGQQDAPFVGGELHGRIVPAKCTWSVRAGTPVDSMLVDEIVLRLVKENKSMWKGLFRRAYT